MTCLHYWSSRSEHWGMTTWLNYIIDTSWNKHRVTIHKIHRWIHSKVTNTSTRYCDPRFDLGHRRRRVKEITLKWIIKRYFVILIYTHSKIDFQREVCKALREYWEEKEKVHEPTETQQEDTLVLWDCVSMFNIEDTNLAEEEEIPETNVLMYL